MTHILHVVGARPNYMKMAPVYRALSGRAQQTLVHTGQHYDQLMSSIFFDQLGLPAPDVNLGIRSDSHAVQTGRAMIAMEPVLLEARPDLVLVYGDINSTMAAALVCSKLGVRLGHVEAGLRSRDRSMPEEVNRIVTDALADLLFTPSADADANLAAEGVSADKVHRVGNAMIDTLVRLLPSCSSAGTRERAGTTGRYVLVTLHRPSNVDEVPVLQRLFEALSELSAEIDVIFPVHPRTQDRLARMGAKAPARLHLIEPVGYLEFIGLERDAALVITDSGGVQEETTYLQVPCLTLRDNTERPITVSVGSNCVVGRDTVALLREARRILAGRGVNGSVPELWDGRAGERVADILIPLLT